MNQGTELFSVYFFPTLLSLYWLIWPRTLQQVNFRALPTGFGAGPKTEASLGMDLKLVRIAWEIIGGKRLLHTLQLELLSSWPQHRQ